MNPRFFPLATRVSLASLSGAFLLLGAHPSALAAPLKAPLSPASLATKSFNPAFLVPLDSVLSEKLPNGVTFIPSVDRIAPRFAASILLRVGAADETPETAGWRRLLINAMLRRAPRGYGSDVVPSESDTPAKVDLEELTRAAEALGGDIGASVGDDTIEVWVTGSSENGPKLLQLALDLLSKPRLDDADLDSARNRQLDQLSAQDLDVAGRISGALRGQLFRTPSGEVAAYGLPEFGTQDSIKNLTNERLLQLYKNTFLPARLTVAVTGDVDIAGMRQVLATWAPTASREPTKPVFVTPKAGAAPLVVRELATNSAWVFVSYPLGEVSTTDAPVMRIITAILGDARGAKLPSRLLNAPLVQGTPVALSVSSQWLQRRYASEILISTQTSSQSVERAKNLVLDEVRKLSQKELTPRNWRAPAHMLWVVGVWNARTYATARF